jgi:LDH2 family malate/lactate/ureidoglycolate dehydrogenase
MLPDKSTENERQHAAIDGFILPIAGHKGYAIAATGEIEARSDERNRRDGLALMADTFADLKRIAGELGLEARLPFAA